MRRIGLGFVVTGMLIFISSPLFALNSEINRSSLQGLEGVRILVEDLAPEVEQAGLAKEPLQKGIEEKLRGAGIKVLTQDEVTRTPGEPYLYVNINVTLPKGQEEACSYSVDIALIQNVILVINPKQTTYAVTWSTGGVGLIGKKSLGQLRESVLDFTTIFVRVFNAMNPKK